MQITNSILMIRPVRFRKNEQTAVNNYYQQSLDLENKKINQQAQDEFDFFVQKLQENGIRVIVINDTSLPDTPDSIFPNNWISFHKQGNVILYPMFAKNRRKERRTDILDTLKSKGFEINSVSDYTGYEEENIFLEGTGSLLLDRIHKLAYCAISPRANEKLLDKFCEETGYKPVAFTANQTVDGQRKPIYHTNVMMCLGEAFSVICLDSIDDKLEKENVIKSLNNSNKEIIEISEPQVAQFTGNMLQVFNDKNQRFIIMSKSALDSLNPTQIQQLKKHGKLLYSSINTIETCGGGSVRCMMAEVFLPNNLDK